MTEIRNSLDFLCASFDEMKNCSRATDKRIDHLLALIKSKDERIEQLEAKVNDLEQNSKKKNIIVTGLNTSSYATVSRPTTRSSTSTDTDDHPPTSTTDNSIMRANFVKFAKSKLDVYIEPYDITAIHELPARWDGKRPIIVQFLSADKKTEIMMKRRLLRGTDIYLNDHLSALNAEMFREARRLKREGKVDQAWTMNCSVFVKRRVGDNKEQIRCKADLAKFVNV